MRGISPGLSGHHSAHHGERRVGTLAWHSQRPHQDVLMRAFPVGILGLCMLVGVMWPCAAQPATDDPRPAAVARHRRPPAGRDAVDRATGSAEPERPVSAGGRIWSMGQPPRWQWQGGVEVDGEHRAAFGTVGTETPFGNPLVGMAAFRVEALAGGGAGGAGGAVRLLAVSPLIRLHSGIDYDVRRQRLDWLVGTDLNVRRGGVVGVGSRLRLEWIPTRGDTVRVGVSVPLGQHAGRTRPHRYQTRLAAATVPPATSGLSDAQRQFRSAAEAVARMTMPLRSRLHGDAARAVAPDVAAVLALGRTDAVLQRMIDAWPALFRAALGADDGDLAAADWVAPRARRIVLEEVVLPFDALLGQYRSPASLWVYGPAAERRLAAELTGAGWPPRRREAARHALRGALSAIDDVRASIARGWRDDRRVFLPLQLALAADEADSQGELDALLERATGGQFTEGNRVDYVVNEAFQFEVARTVAAAERHHVLWIHDVRGQADRGHVDRVSGRQVQQYLEALTARVARYDRSGTLPEYHVVLDQFYYEQYNGRRWMTLLEAPLTHRLALPADGAGTERTLGEAQRALQAAVAGSRRRQEERARYGEAWLHRRVKVHVHITHPSDFSFWGPGLIPLLGMPDNLMRDHRKVVFYDLSEDDPTAGEALFSGMGLGEHYAGAAWEDRALIVKGPAALAARAAARRLLERNGLTGARLPPAFRERPLGPEYAGRAVAFRDRLMDSIIPAARVMQSHNDVGYGDKRATAARAILLSVMPPGSVLISPDSLWESELWGSLLVGSALRGCRVLVIAPSAANAPGTSWLVTARMHMLMSRLLALSTGVAPGIEAQGGLFKVGVFNERSPVGDVGARVAEARMNFEAAGPWFRTLLPISDATLDALQARAKELHPQFPPSYMVEPPAEVRPKLHMKGLFAVSRTAWDGVFAMPEMSDVLLSYLDERVRQVSGRERDVRLLPEAVWKAGRRVIAARNERLSADDTARFIQYLQVGSANMNDRSLLLDGEVTLTVAGLGAQSGLVDFAIVCGLSTWVERQEQIDALLPRPNTLQRLVALWGRSVL
jgi:phosphatidylserine/phosphatidylglycerophosphate/cardiolipin synthase-like enzyme